MDSINSFKGYGKVSPAEDQAFRRKARRRITIIAASAALLLLILVGAVVGVVVNKRNSSSNGEDDHNGSTSSSPAAAIKAVCSVTRYPDSCFSSISSMEGSNLTRDPAEIFRLSLRVAIAALHNLSSLPDSFQLPPNDKRLAAALADCKELFGDAIDRLNDSLSSLPPGADGKQLTAARIDDLRSWLSAAVADQETCLDGFEGTTGGARERLEAAMANSTQFTSNSLAIVAGILGALHNLDDFNLHRKLLAASNNGADGFPAWASPAQRRALQQQEVVVITPNVTVAKDGTGQAKTIQEAVDLVPKKNLYRFAIYVKEGVYEENVVVDKSKWNVMVYGDGMYKTIVTGSRNFIDGTPTFATATFVAAGRGFMARDMGFRNTAGPSKHQAVAMRAGSDRSIFYRCSFDAFQDTLYAHSLRQFYRDCDVAGTVDFIFGDASVVFQKCTIRPRQPLPNQQNTITAQGKKDPNENTGISIQACTISPYDNVTAATYLGRPWKSYSTTVIMQSEIGAVVDTSGWQAWVPGTVPPETINYGEYRNTGPGSIVTGRVTWAGYKPAISADEAAKYTVDSFLNGNEWIPETGVNFVL